MKCNYIFITAICACTLMGCGQSKNERDESGSPGPVTESDKSRYNLNASDEVIYGEMDSLESDSIARDSMKYK